MTTTEPRQDIPHNHFPAENTDCVQDDDVAEGFAQNGDVQKFYPDPNPLPEPLRTYRRELKKVWQEEKTTKVKIEYTLLLDCNSSSSNHCLCCFIII